MRSVRVERLARRVEKVLGNGKIYGQDTETRPEQSQRDSRLVAKVLVYDAGGRLLLLRDPVGGRWDLPGGHLKDSEQAERGAEREVREETGLAVSVMNAKAKQAQFGDQAHTVLLYEAHVADHEPTVEISGEHDAYKWAGKDETKYLNLGAWQGFPMQAGVGHDNVRDGTAVGIAAALNMLNFSPSFDEAAAWAVLGGAIAAAHETASKKLDQLATGQIHQIDFSYGKEHAESRRELLKNVLADAKDGLLTPERTEAVAQEEAHAVYGDAQHRALQRAGYKTMFWVTVGDERVCPECGGNEDAGPVAVGDKFPSGHESPPAHVGCRCWLEGGSKT